MFGRGYVKKWNEICFCCGKILGELRVRQTEEELKKVTVISIASLVDLIFRKIECEMEKNM